MLDLQELNTPLKAAKRERSKLDWIPVKLLSLLLSLLTDDIGFSKGKIFNFFQSWYAMYEALRNRFRF